MSDNGGAVSFGTAGLAVCLCAYTLSTKDGGVLASEFISVFTLLVAAFVVLFCRPVPRLHFPTAVLFVMALYGALQTLFFPHKIVWYGWVGTLFWLTAACITLIASRVFDDGLRARGFRDFALLFGGFICVLDLLEQATRTSHYFWIWQSRYPRVFGTFAYWNNFAQFVEILLPLTLWRGVGGRRPDLRFIVLAAIEIAAVAASGSRAGSLLVIAEVIAVLLLAFLRNRNRAFLYAAASTVVLSVMFVYAAGTTQVMAKLKQQDQLSVRRDINLSSLAMIREHPLTGWGLETYPLVYREFARFDNGAYVNRAHNDWLQWAAEGGIPFAIAMLAVVLWSIRPAVRSIWGIGLLAVCIHALVDYPFARFGVCGWYFALLGMLAARPHGSK